MQSLLLIVVQCIPNVAETLRGLQLDIAQPISASLGQVQLRQRFHDLHRLEAHRDDALEQLERLGGVVLGLVGFVDDAVGLAKRRTAV